MNLDPVFLTDRIPILFGSRSERQNPPPRCVPSFLMFSLWLPEVFLQREWETWWNWLHPVPGSSFHQDIHHSLPENLKNKFWFVELVLKCYLKNILHAWNRMLLQPTPFARGRIFSQNFGIRSEFGVSLVWGIRNFAGNLEFNSLLTCS